MTQNIYIKNYILKIIDSITALVFPIITFSYVTRVIGPEKLGIIDFAQSYGYYFIHIASFGLNSFAIRELSKYRNDREKSEIIGNELFNINFAFSMLSGILYILGVLFVSKFRNNFIIFFLYSFIIFTDFLQIDWILQSFDDYFFSTIRSLIIRICVTILVFILIKNSNHYYIYMIIQTISEMGSRFFNLTYSNKTYFKLKIKPSFSVIKKYFKPLFTLFIFRMVNGITGNLDKLMIGFMLLYEDVSIYNAGVKLILIIAAALEIIGTILFPIINISANKSRKDYISLLYLNYKLIIILGVPLFVGFLLLAPFITILFAGKAYYGSIIIAKIMSISILIYPIGDLLGSKILLVHRNDKKLLLISVIVAISNVILNFIFIPILGTAGAAIASVIGYFIATSLRYYYSKKIVDLNFFNKGILKYFIFTIPFVIIFLCFKELINNNIVFTLFFIIICAIIYLIELLISKDDIFTLINKGVRHETNNN